jgi:hypothetical protein
VVSAYQSLQSSRGGVAAAGDGVSAGDAATGDGCSGATGAAANTVSDPEAGADAASCEPTSVNPGPLPTAGAELVLDPGPKLPAAGSSPMTRCPHLEQNRALERSSVPHLPHQRLSSSTAPPPPPFQLRVGARPAAAKGCRVPGPCCPARLRGRLR